ncbi:ABC transporter substrate-binding protein [Chengkuizengella axinellae]|uniref:Extracellular solute-binding protein n=1 Tax=Chengkuizengella axinellae TaxID=3064388 RepID=A0ABT9IWH3_9BACL|nr:extracellular solute-binding protein [Chengkuizengella sp. 2205SS18-9]MDP5273135.1 extracellular solute-binding protein [Chengkuizengella sp. 2205SS18-9]
MFNRKGLFMFMGMILISFSIVTFIGGTEPNNIAVNQNETDEEEKPYSTQREFQSTKVLEISVSLGDNQLQLLQEFNAEFEKNHKGVNIRLNNVSEDESYELYKQESQIGISSDIMLLDNEWINEFAASGYLIQVDEIINSMNDQFQTLLLAQTKWNRHDWAVPVDSDVYVVVWNPNLVEDSEEIFPPATTAEFVDMIYLNPEQVYIDQKDPFSMLQIITILNAKNDLEETNEEIQSLEIQWDIISKFAYSEDDPWGLLNNGEIMLMITSLNEITKSVDFNYHYSPIQLVKEADSLESPLIGGFIKGRSFAVSSNTNVQKEAFEWLQTLLLDEKYSNLFTDHLVDNLTLSAMSFLAPSPYLPQNISQFNQDIEQLYGTGSSTFLPQSEIWNLDWLENNIITKE